MTIQELIDRRNRLLGKGAALFYRTPVHIVRGDGIYLYDSDGKQYIDMYNNVPCVGHANPHVVEAMALQAGTLNVHSRYLHEGILDYAERILGHHHDSITQVVFTCSGTEANEVAILMAQHATGGRGFICTDAAYHGNSAQVRKLTRVTTSPRNAGEIRAIPYPQTYRPIVEGLSETELCQAYLAEVQILIDSFKADGIIFAGMLVCPILANEGLPDIPKGFMKEAAKLVREAGGLFISDEVQAGMCRTGRWWGYEVMDFVPDIVTMGKPMGNGYPLAAAAANEKIVNRFRQQTHYFNTFASSPVQAAVGNAVLDEIENRKLDLQAASVGKTLSNKLKNLVATKAPGSEVMGDVRSQGLFIGVEWITDPESRSPDRQGAIDMANKLKDKGFLLSNAGANGNIIKIRPPLVFEQHHADLFFSAFSQALEEMWMSP